MISIVMATYNRANFLPDTINNLLSQTYANFEIVVVDDASTDETPEVMALLAEKNGKIRYFRNEVNKGPGYTRNFGVKMAKGKFIAIADDDDWYEPRRLDIQLESCIKYKADLVFSPIKLMDGDREIGSFPTFMKKYKEPVFLDEFFYKLYYDGNRIPNMAILGPKETFVNFPYHEEHYVGEDWYMFLKLAYANSKILALPEPLVKVNRSPGHKHLVKKIKLVHKLDKAILKIIYKELKLPKDIYYRALSNYLIREARYFQGITGLKKWMASLYYNFSNKGNKRYLDLLKNNLKKKISKIR